MTTTDQPTIAYDHDTDTWVPATWNAETQTLTPSTAKRLVAESLIARTQPNRCRGCGLLLFKHERDARQCEHCARIVDILAHPGRPLGPNR